MGLGYTINSASLPGLLSDILLLPCVMEVLQLWIYRTTSFHMLQQFINEVDFEVGDLKVLELGLGGS